MAPSYAVAADFHVRADAIGVMKQVIDDVARPSLSEDGCQIYLCVPRTSSALIS